MKKMDNQLEAERNAAKEKNEAKKNKANISKQQMERVIVEPSNRFGGLLEK